MNYIMNIGTKEFIGILAILVILLMSFQGSQESEVIVIDRPPRQIPTPIFISSGRRRHGGHHGGHHGGGHGGGKFPIKPKIPKAPIKVPKIPIKKPDKDLVPGGGMGGGYPGDPYPGL